MTNNRETALRMAINHAAGNADIADVIALAGEFEKFLDGGTQPAESQPRDPWAKWAAKPLSDFLHPGGFVGRESQERLSDESQAVIRRALTEALQMGKAKIQPEHILLAITKNDGIAGATLIELGGTEKAVRRAVYRRIADNQ